MDKAEARLHMLQRNNQQLSAELSIVRDENGRLEKDLEGMRQKEDDYTDTIAAVDRAWQQLLDDIGYVSRRIKGFPRDKKQDGKIEVKSELPKLENGDPMLQRLISYSSSSTDALARRLEDMADDATEIEKALVPRSIATQQAFVDLIDLHERALTNFSTKESSHSEEPNNTENGYRQAQDNASNLRKEVDAQRALSRTAQAQLKQLTDMLQKDEKTIQELKNELADRKEELNAANRKLYTLREADGLATQNSLPLPVKRPRNSVSPAPSPEPQNNENLRITENELKLERVRADDLGRQVRDLQAKIQDESYVNNTSTFQVLRHQSETESAEIERLRKVVESLQRENDTCKHHIHYLTQQVEDTKHLRRMIAMMEERVREADQQVLKARAAQDAKELEVHAWLTKAGNPETANQLKTMLSTLEKEAEVNRKKLKNRQNLLDDLDKANAERRSTTFELEANKAEFTELQEKFSSKSIELKESQTKELDLKVLVDDLKLFVEMFQTFCEDPRDLADLKVSEAKLKEELETVQNQLKGHELQAEVEKASARADMAEESVEELSKEKTLLERQNKDKTRQCSDLQQQITSLTAEIDAYIGEMEVIGAAYEEMQTKNSSLLQQLVERDERINKLLTEQAQAQHRSQNLVIEAQKANEAKELAQQQAQILQDRTGVLETKQQELTQDLGQTKEKVTTLNLQVETLNSQLRDKDTTISQKESQLKHVTSTADERKRLYNEEAEKCQKEKSKRQRLEEECKVLQDRIEKIGSGQAVSEELEAMRLMTHCQVCHVRRKDHVIVKCWHTFCGECLRRNIESRNRKCPACSHTFGATDVKQIYL